MKLRSNTAGQKPMVSIACVETEIAITSIFSRAKSTYLNAAGGEAGAVPTGMRFSLGGV